MAQPLAHLHSRLRSSRSALLTALVTLLGAVLGGAPPARASTWTVVAPGVLYRAYELRAAAGPARAHVLGVDLTDSGARLGLLSPGVVAGRAAVSRMADRRGAVAGVNGDFFDISEAQHPGVPATGASVGPVIVDGRVLKGAVPDGQRFGPALPPGTSTRDVVGVGTDGRARTDSLSFSGSVATGSWWTPLAGLNQYALPEDSIGAYDRRWGSVSRLRSVCGTDTERSAPCAADAYEVTVRGGVVVSAATAPGSGPITAGTTVLVGREAGARRLRALVRGARVSVRYALTSARGVSYRFALGGYRLLSGGRPLPGVDGTTSAVRTAVGIADGGRRVLLLALDGAPAHRFGLTIAEVADVLRGLGATEGFSLDGGGSSTLVARPPGADSVTVRNHPAGGVERPVPNGIGVFSR
ncbi:MULTISPECIES: phosphodiester glycosidase family protein [unclassified Streptomyces]|uniref:phosphodiester glycosidase family protein n=1 Tax=unclassified Streptomyces TaxID=2593676 RepID=UPI003D724F7D